MIWIGILIIGSFEMLMTMIFQDTLQKRLRRLSNKVRIIEKHANETIKCFNKKYNFVALAKTQALHEEVNEVMKQVQEDFPIELKKAEELSEKKEKSKRGRKKKKEEE